MANSLEFSEEMLYSQLPESVQKQGKKLGLKKAAKTRFLTAFLQQTVPAKLLKDGLEDSLRYQQKTVNLDNMIRDREKKKAPKRQKLMTAKQRKELKLLKLDENEKKYDLYLPLHFLWKDYMNSLLDFSKMNPRNMVEFERKILKADLHGCMIKVTRSKCVSLVGREGIVLQETKNAFLVITSANELKTIPKQNSVFSFELGGHLLTIYGNSFRFKASERSVRSFKSKQTIDL